VAIAIIATSSGANSPQAASANDKTSTQQKIALMVVCSLR
jgi:hypothetical protein